MMNAINSFYQSNKNNSMNLNSKILAGFSKLFEAVAPSFESSFEKWYNDIYEGQHTFEFKEGHSSDELVVTVDGEEQWVVWPDIETLKDKAIRDLENFIRTDGLDVAIDIEYFEDNIAPLYDFIENGQEQYDGAVESLRETFLDYDDEMKEEELNSLNITHDGNLDDYAEDYALAWLDDQEITPENVVKKYWMDNVGLSFSDVVKDYSIMDVNGIAKAVVDAEPETPVKYTDEYGLYIEQPLTICEFDNYYGVKLDSIVVQQKKQAFKTAIDELKAQ